MGNRTFLYTTDSLPDPTGEHEPSICNAVAEANNFLPPLWLALLSAAQLGPAQDEQQVFLPSIVGGVYAPRALGEQRLFQLLDYIGRHPMLAKREQFLRKTAALRDYLATLEGSAYSADLNEWFHLCDTRFTMDQFIRDCAQRWENAERAMAAGEYAALEHMFEFTASDAADSLGFRCWSHPYFDRYQDAEQAEPEPTFAQFCLEHDTDEVSEDYWLGHDLYAFEKDGKYGVRSDDPRRGVLLPAIYDAVDTFEAGMQVASLTLDGLWGLFDSSGKIVMQPMLEDLYEAEDGVAVACMHGQFGYVDGHGRWLVEPRYDDADAFSFKMARVIRGGLAGYIDERGVEVITPQFMDDSGAFTQHGFASVQTAEGYGVINKKGAFVVQPRYRKLEWLEGLAAWSGELGGGNHDVYFEDGRAWFSSVFEGIEWFMDSSDALMTWRGLQGTFQRNGQPGIPFLYSDIVMVLEGEPDLPGGAPALYEVSGTERKKRCGACIADGTLVIPLEYKSIDPITFVPHEDRGATGWVPHPTQHLLVSQGNATGVWSLALKRQVLDCSYNEVYGFRIDGTVYFLAYKKRQGWTVADAAGTVLTKQHYAWLGAESITGTEEYHAFLLGGELVRCWSRGDAVQGWSENSARRLYQDGREESELDYLLRRVYDPRVTPIVAFDTVVQGLPQPAKSKRPASHVIAGVGDADACYELATIYAEGQGVPEDLVKACRWYATAAAGGHQEAQYYYGLALTDGLGCEPDPMAALAILDALGPDHVRALNIQGYIHECQLGSPNDLKRARALYQAASHGESKGYAVAQRNAGHCWRFGKGGPADLPTALKYYEWAAADRRQPGDASEPDACRCAAEVYCDLAEAAPQPHERELLVQKAIYYYLKMLGHGLDGALVPLARCYLGEFGGGQDLKAARDYLSKARAIDEYSAEAVQVWNAHQLGG